ncbi:MAG: LPS assembly lipoprotein LptE [Desulfobacterales bacterium]
MDISGKVVGIGILAVFTIAACGYRFTGGGELPAGVQRIYMTIFTNRTSELGVESVLAAQLTNEFLYFGPRGVLVNDRQAADAELSGVISTVQIYTATLRTQLSSAERRVVITVAARLTATSGKDIWRVDALSAGQPYRVEADKSVTEANRRAAIAIATGILAETIYNRMTSNF